MENPHAHTGPRSVGQRDPAPCPVGPAPKLIWRPSPPLLGPVGDAGSTLDAVRDRRIRLDQAGDMERS